MYHFQAKMQQISHEKILRCVRTSFKLQLVFSKNKEKKGKKEKDSQEKNAIGKKTI